MSKPSTFYMPKSPTGRMDHGKPEIQMLLMPTHTLWQRELAKIRNLSQQSVDNGRTYVVSKQEKGFHIKAGSLVVWAPTGEPGLWLVTDINPEGEVDYAKIERSLANLSPEAQIVYNQKYKLTHPHVCPRGSLRLEWEGGWAGYANDRKPVVVKIEEVEAANAMEALGIAAL